MKQKTICVHILLGYRKEDEMMPLSMVKEGEPNVIKKVGGKEETRKFLENLGFVTGGVVTVVSEIRGNLIVNVKDSRVAIGKDMANKIMV
jgi:ferrous iron transport protein A